MYSEWLNILITSYSKEAINTGTLKSVFLRESKFFKKGYIIHSNAVRSSHRKVQNKHIGIYFFTAPIYHRSVMTGSYKNNTVNICFILPQSFLKKGTYVWVNIREKLCDCHKLSIGWLLLGLVILTYTKIGACVFLV